MIIQNLKGDHCYGIFDELTKKAQLVPVRLPKRPRIWAETATEKAKCHRTPPR